MTNCVILGGGLAGLLAAVALRNYASRITVVERDRYPGRPLPRRGSPQSRHSHVMVGGGAWAIEELLPGITADLMKAGAIRIRLPQDALVITSSGLSPSTRSTAYCISCSKDLLDYCIRRRADLPVLEGATATGLVGDATGIRGVTVTDHFNAVTSIESDLVVDAMGRGSRASRWLASLDIQTEYRRINSDLSAASRRYQLSGVAIPAIVVQPKLLGGPDYRLNRGGTLFPIENGQIMVTLTGALSDRPPDTEASFLEFANSLREGVISNAIRCSKPISKIYTHHNMSNVRRYVDAALPGFVAIGDSLMAVTPNHSTGMATAALAALSVQRHLENHGCLDGLQSAISSASEMSWNMATRDDASGELRNAGILPPPNHGLSSHRFLAAAQSGDIFEAQTLVGVAKALGMPVGGHQEDSAPTDADGKLSAFQSWLSWSLLKKGGGHTIAHSEHGL